MRFYFLLLLLNAGIFFCKADELIRGGECRQSKGNSKELRLSINRKLDESDGQYYRNFSAWREDSKGVSSDLTLEAKHKTVECDGTLVTHINAIVKEMKNEEGSKNALNGRLLFHPKHGRNAVILDNGRSVQKLEVDDPHNAVVFTNRPLKNNELFEVRLEKRMTTRKYCLGIGVISVSPEEVDIVPEMYQYRNVTWVYHNDAIYQNKKVLLGSYGRNINDFQVRERLGVMRRDDGELHFFVNGVDQGRAASNMPQELYGIYELWNDAVKGTIVY